MAAAHVDAPSPSMERKKCFNVDCSESTSRKGWRLRSGELADLCDRCASLYEEGRFCETFHPNAPGWRCCFSCKRRFHCGCMVSRNAFILLDFGEIMCSGCARFRIRGAPWATFSRLFVYDKIFKDQPIEKWIHVAGPTPHELPFFSNSIPHEIDRPVADEKSSGASEGQQTGNRDCAALVVLDNENAGASKEDRPGSSWDTMLLPSSGQESLPIVPSNEANGQIVAAETPLQVQGNLQNGIDLPVRTRKLNYRPRVNARGTGEVHPRYWPRFSHEELRLIAGNSDAQVTPLFEKMLSATDAGKTGRLVLPKRCAEAYFPPLDNQGGINLSIQDTAGQDWIFHYRFWPNNKSRMYVLEGVAPYMKRMQLQARDTVTFSRLDPERKLVMGFRKALLLGDQDNVPRQTVNGLLMIGDAEMAGPSRQPGVVEGKSSTRKRKSSATGSKNKQNEDKTELMLTMEEARASIRPLPNQTPNVVVVGEYVFEEFQEAPVIGKPTVFAVDQSSGLEVQWVQCEDCSKWRKVPADAMLPANWTCPDNGWDLERSLCSKRQELNAKQLKDVIPSHLRGAPKKRKARKGNDDNVEATEGLDTLSRVADLVAITGERGEPSNLSLALATTKHPRHGPGCSCIVCTQPPSDNPTARRRSKKRAT